MKKLTHKELCDKATRWLEIQGCRVVATEIATRVSETPDAIGFKGSGSCIVVECKTSMADFHANKNKCHERTGDGMGDFRWFFAEKGLIDPKKLPEDWGLVEYKGRCYKTVHATRRTKSSAAAHNEKELLISCLWRALYAASLVRPLGMGESEIEDDAPDAKCKHKL